MKLPTQKEIELVLKKHHLIKLKEKVRRAFLIGSFASGKQNKDSDVDILLEIDPQHGFTELEFSEWYRRALRQYFVTHDIKGKCDSVHPQWEGRRVDLYFTYNADKETRPKIQLDPEAWFYPPPETI